MKKLVLGFCAVAALVGCEPHEVTVTVKSFNTSSGEAPADTGSSTSVAGYGSLEGTVKLQGTAVAPALLIKKGDAAVKDAAVCAAIDIQDESLLVDGESQGIANVVIFLEKKPKNIKPELAKVPAEPVIFDQKYCRFFPHVVVVQVGQTLLVKSDDSIIHNTHIYPERNDGFSGGIRPGDRDGVPLNYTKPENQPFEVKCDLHPWMRAFHFPIDHPYFAVTDAKGNYKIDGLPAGQHTLKVWHERGKVLEKITITIKPDAAEKKDLEYGASRLALGRVAPRFDIAAHRHAP